MDTIDQMAETLERIQSISRGDVPPPVRRYQFVYSVVVNGRTIDGSTPRPMTVSECNDFIERTHRIDLGNNASPKVDWGRGYIGNNGNAVVHPASNGAMFDHVYGLLQQVKTRQAKRR